MLAKNWKRILLIVVIIACIINLGIKLSKKVSFDRALDAIKIKIETTINKDNE